MSTVATVYSESNLMGSSPKRWQIVVIEGPDMGRAAAITSKALLVGKAPGSGLELRDDRVSDRHLEVGLKDGEVVVKDLESTNGTWFEGARFSSGIVRAGTTLRLGRTFVRIQSEAEALSVTPSQARSFGELVGESLAMREVFAVLELVAGSNVTILLEGETGTGKELAARSIHGASPRRRSPFVAIDCGALPETLLESELFGHVRGAFTGASQGHKGAFVRANGGTLFLDELGSISENVQARLLRVIEERKVRPVGAESETDVDVRIVAASRVSLESQVAAGLFRPDLYYRLAVVKVSLPALRNRREDLKPMVEELCRRCGMDPGPIAGPNFDRLLTHGWPGNGRELRNVIDRAIALSPRATTFRDLRVSVPSSTTSENPLPLRCDLPFAEAKELLLHDFEGRYLRELFERCDRNISETSRVTGIDRKHLKQLLRRHSLLAVGETDRDDD